MPEGILFLAGFSNVKFNFVFRDFLFGPITGSTYKPTSG